MRVQRLIEALLTAVGTTAVASESRQPFYADQQLRENEKRAQVEHDGRYVYLEGADGLDFAPREQAQVGMANEHNAWAPHGAVPLSLSEMSVTAKADEAGAERSGGAPNEHYAQCATKDEGKKTEKCDCYKGEVRFGSTDEDVWTLPTMMGEHESVDCTVEGFQKRRVHVPSADGAPASNQCQCIERLIRISTSVMSLIEVREKLSSFAEEDDEAPKGLYDDDKGGTYKMCLTVPVAAIAESSNSLGQLTEGERAAVDPMQRMLDLELATDVEMKDCSDDDDTQIWTLLLSSGQIRHNKSGKCLGVYFDAGTPHLKANDCTLTESQVLTQRWHLPFYQMPDFEEGSGKIELGYGHESQMGYCLSSSGMETLSLVKCSSGPSEWKVETATEPHGWSTCSQESGNCGCIGEIKFGSPETNSWTSAVPVPNELDTVADVKCDLQELRDIAIHDPVLIPNIDNPDLRQCQCRGKKPLPGEEEVEGGGKGPLIIGVALGAVAIGVGGYFATKGGDPHAGEHEEGEYEEEEYEEEEYEEE